MDGHNKTQEIKELCQLLKGDDVPVTLWYKNVTEAMQDVDSLTTFEFADEKERKSVNMPILPQLFHILRECLLNHRWSEAVEVMKSFVNVPGGTSQTIWKVGTELLGKEAQENRDLVQQLYSQVKMISELNSKEIVMEFVTYLLQVGEDVVAAEAIQEVLKRHGPKTESVYREEYTNKLHKAYLGLLWYLEWKHVRMELEELKGRQGGSTESESLSQNPMQTEIQSLTMQIRNFGDKAISCFKELEGYPGVWDIFVTKHAELLVSADEKTTAFYILKNYCKTNADSLNAHKYLYNFCKELYPNQKDELQALKVIARLSPSDAVVLDLCTRLIKGNESGSPVQYLFHLLDYSCWKMQVKPWKMLANCCRSSDKNDKKVVNSCWRLRKSWWPAYHFTEHALDECVHEKELMFHKAVVAYFLCGQDTKFVKEAKQYLTEEENRVITLTTASTWETT